MAEQILTQPSPKTQESTTYKYYYLSRPPSLFTQPDGFTDREAWWPRRHPEEFPRGAFGWATYPERLSLYKAWKFDLWPADKLEALAMTAWLESDRDGKRALRWLAEFWEPSAENREYLTKSEDFIFRACWNLQQAGREWAEVEAVMEGVE